MLQDSIIADGFTQPVLVRRLKEDELETADEGVLYEIVDGEHRWRAAQGPKVAEHAEELGLTAGIPCVVVEMDRLQQMLSMQRHNGARGSDDVDALASLMHDFEAMGALSTVQHELGMEDEEVARLMMLGADVLEELAGDDPKPAWEIGIMDPGNPDHHYNDNQRADPDGRVFEKQSVSDAVKAIGVTPRKASSAIAPGLGLRDPEVAQAMAAMPQMSRRAYVVESTEAAILDRALEAEEIDGVMIEGASKLIWLCRQHLISRGMLGEGD